MKYYEKLIHQDADVVMPTWEADEVISELRFQVSALQAENKELRELIAALRVGMIKGGVT